MLCSNLLQWGFEETSFNTFTSFLQCCFSFSRLSWQSSLNFG